MANRSMSAAIRNVGDAEKIIQSYAYGDDLDEAIAYLQENDPKNAVLAATIKDFENDRATLKALQALYRADEARKQNDTAELENIAKFLSLSENEEMRNEAIRILREEVPEQIDDEKVEAIDSMLDALKEHASEKEDSDKPAELTDRREMSDDEIFANANEIDTLIESEDIEGYVWNHAARPAQKQVTITDDDGQKVDDATADDLWKAKMRAALNEVTMSFMDNSEFAECGKEDKCKTLRETAVDIFMMDLYGIGGASRYNPQVGVAENRDSIDGFMSDYNAGKKVDIKADHFVASAAETKRKMDKKADELEQNGKSKSGSWLKRASQRFGLLVDKCKKKLPEIKQAAIGYFSSARGIGNTIATAALVGSTFISAPAVMAVAAGYGIYHALSASQYSVFEKRNANLAAAKARGDAAEVKIWQGTTGLRNAYKAIMANPIERKRFKRQRWVNLTAGLGSAAVMAVAAPLVVAGGATLTGAKALASSIRLAGANVNAGLQWRESVKQAREDKTEESAKGAKRAKVAFWAGALISAVSEFFMIGSAAHAAAQENVAQAALMNHADTHTQGNGLPEAEWGSYAQENAGNSADVASAADATVAGVDVVVPEEWNASMGISEAHWNEMHDKFTGIFKDRADIFNMDNKAPNLTWQNMYNNIEHAQQTGALPQDLTKEQILYKYMKLVENTERAEPVPGTRYLRTMLDADKEPMYWVDQKEMRALNHIILCGSESEVSAADLGKSLARINDSGVYVGEGANVGVTHNRFVGFGRGEDCPEGTNNVNAWERVKGAIKRVIHKAPVVEEKPDVVVEQAPIIEDKPEVDNVVDTDVKIVDKTPQDVMVDDGARIATKYQVGTTDTGNDGQLNTINDTSYGRGHARGTGVIPGSVVNAGRER